MIAMRDLICFYMSDNITRGHHVLNLAANAPTKAKFHL